MKQIKTIIRDAIKVEAFDKDVNEAIADGWTLTKRDVWDPYQCMTTEYHRCLYAELEREIITEAERTCENCAHSWKESDKEPCVSCSEDCDKWEAER